MLRTNLSGFREPGGKRPTQIKITTNYGKFKFLVGNRDLNPGHLSALEMSMSKWIAIFFVLINELGDIIDGQHRYNILRKMGLPIPYVIQRGLRLEHAIALNSIQGGGLKWKEQNYIKSWYDLGYEEYSSVLEFLDQYNLPNTGMKMMMARTLKLGREFRDSYLGGSFICEDWKAAHKDARFISGFKEHFGRYRSMIFVKAMLKIKWQFKHDGDRLETTIARHAEELLAPHSDLAFRIALTRSYNKGLSKNKRKYFYHRSEQDKKK